MTKVVKCECGELVQASTDEEVIEKVHKHIDTKHPDLAGKMTDEDILAMVEEA